MIKVKNNEYQNPDLIKARKIVVDVVNQNLRAKQSAESESENIPDIIQQDELLFFALSTKMDPTDIKGKNRFKGLYAALVENGIDYHSLENLLEKPIDDATKLALIAKSKIEEILLLIQRSFAPLPDDVSKRLWEELIAEAINDLMKDPTLWINIRRLFDAMYLSDLSEATTLLGHTHRSTQEFLLQAVKDSTKWTIEDIDKHFILSKIPPDKMPKLVEKVEKVRAPEINPHFLNSFRFEEPYLDKESYWLANANNPQLSPLAQDLCLLAHNKEQTDLYERLPLMSFFKILLNYKKDLPLFDSKYDDKDYSPSKYLKSPGLRFEINSTHDLDDLVGNTFLGKAKKFITPQKIMKEIILKQRNVTATCEMYEGDENSDSYLRYNDIIIRLILNDEDGRQKIEYFSVADTHNPLASIQCKDISLIDILPSIHIELMEEPLQNSFVRNTHQYLEARAVGMAIFQLFLAGGRLPQDIVDELKNRGSDAIESVARKLGALAKQERLGELFSGYTNPRQTRQHGDGDTSTQQPGDAAASSSSPAFFSASAQNDPNVTALVEINAHFLASENSDAIQKINTLFEKKIDFSKADEKTKALLEKIKTYTNQELNKNSTTNNDSVSKAHEYIEGAIREATVTKKM